MRKFVTLLAAVACWVTAEAQFTLTPSGFVNDKSPKEGYYLIECPGQSADEIFRTVAYFMESSFAFPWTGFNAMEPESFTVTTTVPGAVVDSKRPSPSDVYDVEFRWRVDIRDGAVKVWAPEVNSLSREASSPVSLSLGIGVGTGDIEVPPVVGRSFMFLSTHYRPGQTRQYSAGSSAIFNRRGKLKHKILKASLEDYFNSYVVALEKYLGDRGTEW